MHNFSEAINHIIPIIKASLDGKSTARLENLFNT